MGHWFTHWTTIYLSTDPMCCSYNEIGGTRIEATIPANFTTSLYDGVNITYPTGNITSRYETKDSILTYGCVMAFLIFDMFTAKNNINLKSADFGVVLEK